ncbi:MAG: hypothetical protein JW795_13660 [Chitinivibrionales bacterium]|nr:hypothetical protein [Chitinivibrionales bacterium]
MTGVTAHARKPSTIRCITITAAKLVIDEVKLHSAIDDDSLSFESSRPYILRFDSNTVTTFIDSAFSLPGSDYDGLKLSIDKLDKKFEDLYGANPELRDASIWITGIIDTGSSLPTGSPLPFVFTSQLDETIKQKFSPSLKLTKDSQYGIVLSFGPAGWFRDESGQLLDPRDASARKTIEKNIMQNIGIRLCTGRAYGIRDALPDRE